MNPISLLKPRRKITGISAILLPFTSAGEVDWAGFDLHVERTLSAGLAPAVNMDTGYANLIDESTREEVLRRTQAICSGKRYVGGVFVPSQEGATFDLAAYQAGIGQVVDFGGTPILFQSYGLVELAEPDLVDAYRTMGSGCDEFLFFELGTMFAPFGRIYSIEVYEQLMQIPTASGAKHSSLRRAEEWQRLALRDRVRPDFKVFTGNDLAVDMVMYGSDYLLGLSTFAPDAFALRDSYWENGDDRFYELNDLLQYLGAFAFRNPTSAYKHSAAMFLHLRGQIASNLTHPKSPTRPDSDLEILREIAQDLGRMTGRFTGVSS
ncbi:MAG: dihydrodipicolinate synthase family protein [Rubripirellula sp.]